MSYLLVFMLAISSLAGGLASWEHVQNLQLHDKISILEIKTQIQDESIRGYTNQLAQTIQRVEYVEHQSELINSNAQVKVEVLTSHNLALLAEKKAGLVEIRVNKGSQRVLDSLENLTDPQWHP